jgi:ribosome biogenesis GTPase
MIRGLILKGVGGQYTVKTKKGKYVCEPRGVLKLEEQRLLVGDFVQITIIDSKNNEGVIEKILPRKSELFRPAVANVSQVVVCFSVKKPEIQLDLLDKLLTLIEYKDLKALICLNKVDIDEQNKIADYEKIYKKAGYPVIITSAKNHTGIDALKDHLKDEISVFAGPSGVGKSSILNKIQPNLQLRTGEISKKSQRGKHTTRHTELIELKSGGWVFDTPGFMNLDVTFIDKWELKNYFKEFENKDQKCKFNDCLHLDEPKCYIKALVEQGEIAQSRYDSYVKLMTVIENNRRF